MRKIDPFLMNKLRQSVQTMGTNANPKMQIAVAKARNSVMDNSYWTVETINEGGVLGDVSVVPRRNNPFGRPNRIYAIVVEGGVVKTLIREFPDKFKDGFKYQFTIGQGSNVAIAFDGEWQRHRASWRLVTHEKPWVFWVTNGELFTQHWDDEDTRRTLANNVIFCKAIRGWKNLNLADKDQGIVIGYIKTDGKVYYRNYCQMLDLSYIWEGERQVTEFTGNAHSLNLFLTNDYRLGFTVADTSDDIYWYITDRNWAGMALEPGHVYIPSFKISGSVMNSLDPLEYLDLFHDEEGSIAKVPSFVIEPLSTHEVPLVWVRDTVNDILEVWNESVLIEGEEDWGKVLYVKMTHYIINASPLDFHIKDIFGRTYVADSIELVSVGLNYLYKLIFEEDNNFNNVDQEGTLWFSPTTGTNGKNELWDETFMVFYPVNLEPEELPLPEFVSASSNAEGTELCIEFSQAIMESSEGGFLTDGFVLTGEEYRWIDGPTHNGELKPMIIGIEEVDFGVDNLHLTLRLNSSTPFNNLCNLIGPLTISYNGLIGGLRGAGGSVLDFTETVVLDNLVQQPNPAGHHGYAFVPEFHIVGSSMGTLGILTFHEKYHGGGNVAYVPQHHISGSEMGDLDPADVVNP